METLGRVGLYYACVFAIGLAYFVALQRGRGVARAALLVLVVPALAMPLVIPASERLLRLACACQSVAQVCKLHDILNPRTGTPGFTRYARFMLNPTSLVLRRLDAERELRMREVMLGIGCGVLAGAVGVALFAGIYRLDLGKTSFALEHGTKLVTFYIATLGGIAVLVGRVRLSGSKARAPMHDIFRARTPAELWRRYNRTVGQYFQENLFPLFGGYRHPVRATLLVFAASSVVHEYVFGIAIGAVQGWQTAFFMIQGVGVAATLRARPRGGHAVAAMLGTLAFNLVTSVLFFMSVQQILPFWSASPMQP